MLLPGAHRRLGSDPSAVGEIVKAALLSYGDASAPPPDGGTADGGATE
jgi:hypothetical protein